MFVRNEKIVTEEQLGDQALQENKRIMLNIFSENPLEQIWNTLMTWESDKLASKLVRGRAEIRAIKIGNEQVKMKAQALNQCLRNARENFSAANQNSLTTRVTNQYYGCMWLASAMMVADPASTYDLHSLEKTTKQGHGLGNISSKENDFPNDEYIIIKEQGLFPQFLKWSGLAKKQLKKLRLKTVKVHNFEDVDENEKSKLFSLSDMFARIPEISDSYHYATGNLPLVFPVNHSDQNMIDEKCHQQKNKMFADKSNEIEDNENYSWIGIGSSIEFPLEFLNKHGPPLTDYDYREFCGRKSASGKILHNTEQNCWSNLLTYKSAMSPTVWVNPLGGEINDLFSIHFALLYQLSILARYRPAVWREVLEGELGHFRSLTTYYSSVVARILPEIALKKIYDGPVWIATPGSLSGPV